MAAGDYVRVDELERGTLNRDNDEQVCEDILDVFESYYKVAQKQFVDVVFQQVIVYFLLRGEESPLKVFGPNLVMGLENEQLELIAGEDEETNQQRNALEHEIGNLEEALKIL
ncbi:Uncharacterized protein TPAR_05438 [Tolypocladium paradoxum]|uniref:GED domain-containing protein n=1 Tax=Tolypocladium paradoxum TaxID=94208 RepID=A0A2S4KW03_9HYPO|nr:Uncharacterized protein TPAR_05438 [Tolypocladium paradoxum]